MGDRGPRRGWEGTAHCAKIPLGPGRGSEPSVGAVSQTVCLPWRSTDSRALSGNLSPAESSTQGMELEMRPPREVQEGVGVGSGIEKLWKGSTRQT